MSVYSSPTKYASDVMQAVKRRFGDESGVQLEDSDLLAWINEAQDAIVAKNGVIKGTATTTSVIGQSEYTFPTQGIHRIESVLYDGVRVRPMSLAQAEESISTRDPLGVEKGVPQIWYEWAGTVTFWPKPSDEKTITLRYTAKATRVTTNDSLLSIPDTYYQDVVNYVLKQAYEMDENSEMVQLKGREFESSMIERSLEEDSNRVNTYPVITLVDEGY